MAQAGLPACTLAATRMSELQAIDPKTVTRDTEYEKIGGMLHGHHGALDGLRSQPRGDLAMGFGRRWPYLRLALGRTKTT